MGTSVRTYVLATWGKKVDFKMELAMNRITILVIFLSLAFVGKTEARSTGMETQACNCNIYGTVGNVDNCDDNGACPCKANVEGDKCDTCSVGYDNFPLCIYG